MSRLIALTGLPGCGKDTIGATLANAHGFARMNFAGPMKDGLVVMLGIPRQSFEDHAAKEQEIPWIGKSPRQLLQSLGTEWGREMVHSELWLRHAQRRLDNYRRISADVVITDMRFPNEANWLRANGGELWHVLRKETGIVVNMHASNIPLAVLPGADSVIQNDEGLAQLQDQVRHALAGECRIEKLHA